MWQTIMTKLLGSFSETAAQVYIEKKKLEHERDMEKLRGKIAYEAAKTERAIRSEGLDHEWELESIRNSGWKDEWVLVLLSIPLVLVFIPWTQDTVLTGFQTLEQTPEWYRWIVMVIFLAIYGVRLWRRDVTPKS